jgi:hypothetical protein
MKGIASATRRPLVTTYVRKHHFVTGEHQTMMHDVALPAYQYAFLETLDTISCCLDWFGH